MFLKRIVVSLFLVVAAGQESLVSAELAAALNPLESVSAVSLSIVVGGKSTEEPLFDDWNAEQRFVEDLERELTAEMAKVGIEIVKDSDDLVSVGIWGHRVTLRDGRRISVFTLEVGAMDADYYPSGSCEHNRDLNVESGAVGYAEEGELEMVLKSEIFGLLEDMLPNPNRGAG